MDATRESADRPGGSGRAAALGLGAGLCVVGFWSVGDLYGGFTIPYGLGFREIHPAELVVWAWYLAFGIPAVLLGAMAVAATSVPQRAVAILRRAARQPGSVGVAVVAMLGIVFAARAAVLHFAPIADDESTYVFIAQTLLEGRLTNPAPEDPQFFANQFVILDGESWYGKYPIGHPLVLAAGQAVGLRALVPPILTALSLLLTFAIGRRVLGGNQAFVAGALLLVSPQFILTGATELSQLTSGLCLLLAVFALLRMDAGGGLGFAALAGTALGFGVLARPLPGVLFLAIAAVWMLIRYQDQPVAVQAKRIAVGLAPIAACGMVMLIVHSAQTGDPTTSGYDAFHGQHGGFFRLDWIAGSVAGALLRQNIWLFGWPLSFLFLPFARRDGRAGLLWGMLIASYAYRVILPKTVVASTGPIYVAEAVPLLALLTASGMGGATARLAAIGIARERAQAAVASLALAGIAFAALTFAPLQIRELRRSGNAWQTANRLLDEAGAQHALVFADQMVDASAAASWAYYPPNPSPDLADPRVFVRIPHGEDGPQRAREFWQRRFPDRSAWVFVYHEGEPKLHRLGG